jgi:hypothetical protein
LEEVGQILVEVLLIQEEIDMPKVNPKDKDKHTLSSSLLTLTIENDLHNPCIAQGRGKQLSCHRVDVVHSLTIDHITTSC